MSLLVTGLAALVVGLLGPSGPDTDLPAPARVVVDELEVFDEPDDRSVASGLIHAGDRVMVRQAEPDGWLAIDPPGGTFRWIDQSSIQVNAAGDAARVIVPKAQVRAGHPGARMPGPPRGSLAKGAEVQLLERPPLKTGKGKTFKTWRAIVPAAGEQLHIHADGIAWIPKAKSKARVRRPSQEAQATYINEAAQAPLPQPSSEVAGELAQIEASHRTALRGPIEDWQLGPVKRRYEALLKRTTDAASITAIRARLDRLVQQEETAKSARTIEQILNRSRDRDAKLAAELERLAKEQEPQEPPYDAEGMIQPSSKKVDGHKVFALIGPDGLTVAYLNAPDGLNPTPLLGRKVGVRGSMHYDANLRARLIAVRDLEPLDEDKSFPQDELKP